ncbi:Putative protein disulfide-isomerase [Verticillium dahliae VDG1]|nr:Putative protein disulfide-isomerase [Verticillium dahliae VDG1]
MRLSLVPALFGVLAAAVPTEEQAASHREDKRQLGSLLGIFNRDATFDYVIIGGGTAGLTLANRLSANRDMTVYTATLARRIVFDGAKRATGVVVSSALALGQYTLRARREVLLSAGAFQSPQLLMVSGVGPRAQLSKLGIPVVADRPGVGQTMEDHGLRVVDASSFALLPPGHPQSTVYVLAEKIAAEILEAL